MILPEIEVLQRPLLSSCSDRVLCLGSCFGEHLQAFLDDIGLSAFHRRQTCNHFNPASLAVMLRLPEDVDAETLEVGPSRYFGEESAVLSTPHLRWLFSETPAAVVALTRRYLRELEGALLKADIIVWTLGTADVLRSRATGQVLCSANGLSPDTYQFDLLDLSQILEAMLAVWGEITSRRAPPALIITLSPQRYFWDAQVLSGADVNETSYVRNVQSKSRLRCAIDAFCERVPEAIYFPAYEIVLDELRLMEPLFDGRSLTHVSATTPGIVLERFERAHFSNELHEYHDCLRKVRRLNHIRRYCEGVDQVLAAKLAHLSSEAARLERAGIAGERLAAEVLDLRQSLEARP